MTKLAQSAASYQAFQLSVVNNSSSSLVSTYLWSFQ